MRFTFAASVILAAVLAFIAPINSSNSTSAQTDCVQALTYDLFASDGSFVGRWIDDDSLDCASVHRPADEDAPRDGIYLARYYTFSMSEAADVAITLESPIDTYLYLLEGKGTDGAVLHKNDDIDYEADNLNSRIRETLQSGDYTIEATTYDAVYPTPVIEFRLTTSGITLQPSADDDRAALTTLYHATNGPNWRRSNNWLTDAPLGEWYGVTTGADGRVTVLSLNANNLSGHLPADLGNLPNLEGLYLSNNNLSGEIPSELGNLTELEVLSISRNNLTGTIPSNLSSLDNLSHLYLLHNRLTGTIPPELGNLSELENLFLSHNQLTGTIPPVLGNLSNLTILDLEDSRLTGTIPPELGNLSELENLFLSDNQLTGTIPPELGNLSELKNLFLSHNQLTGTIPPELGSLSNLALLFLSDNQLAGTIPPELGNLDELDILKLDENQLTGHVPSELGNLSNLEYLDISGNALTGELPHSLTNLSLLDILTFSINAGLCAPIDSAFQTWLQSLSPNLVKGNTCGTPPPRTVDTDRTALTSFYHSANGDNWTNNDNWLTNAPLSEWHGVSTHPNGLVTSLDLRQNGLSGGISPAIGNLAFIKLLDLSDNRLIGTIPPELDDIRSYLEILHISDNQLTGTIPPELGGLSNLKSLNLSNNQLTGSISSESIEVLFNLKHLDLSNNRLSGQIPHSIDYHLYELERLALDGNQLTGELPQIMTSLRRLMTLHFHNNAGLCAPTDASFQAWLQSMDNVEGPNCGDTQPPTPTLPTCVESLPSDMTIDDGAWNTECTSSVDAPSGSGDRYARFFTFTLDAESDVTIDLSSDKDTYLYLRSGASTDGTVTHENDDRATDNYDSMIEERLDSGTYTVEATTYAAGVTGSFTLAVTVVPVPDTTELEPPPDPTTLIPESCALQSFSGTSVNDSWTSDCVSQNRTENGAHYAKFFSFSVSRSATYDITLVSRTDPYLILLDSAGDIIDSDDDDDNGLFNLGSRNSGIRIALDPGDYIFEATTHAGSATGDFTLTILRP